MLCKQEFLIQHLIQHLINMASNTEVKTLIDSQITDITATGGVTNGNVGALLKSMVDLMKPYKEVRFLLQVSAGTATPTYEVNDFSAATMVFTNPTNGRIRISESTGNFFTNGKVEVTANAFEMSGTPYFLIANADALPYQLDLEMMEADGTQTITPSVGSLRITIKIYD